jgi:hypothetical protein
MMIERTHRWMREALILGVLLGTLALTAATAGSDVSSQATTGAGAQAQAFSGTDSSNQGSEGLEEESTADFSSTSGSEETIEDLVATAATEVDTFWNELFAANELPYSSPDLAYLYEGPTETGCGIVDPVDGPFYCALDQTIYYSVNWVDPEGYYLDEYGDFAVATVIAHEMAHHVQQQMDIMEMQDVGDLHSIESELQADCFAGAWANAAYYEGQLEDGDIEEALSTLAAVADPEGTPADDPTAHGGAEERQEWFLHGYDTGDVSECVT